MDIHEYYQSIVNEMEHKKYAFAISDSASFLSVITEKMLNAESIPAEVDSYYFENKIGSHNVRIDGALHDGDEFHLFVVDYNPTQFGANLTLTDCDRLTNQLSYFVEDSIRQTLQKHGALDISMPEYGLADELREFAMSKTADTKKKITLYVLTNRNAEGGLKQYRLKRGEIEGLSIDLQVWDIERVYKIETSLQGRQAIDINFADYGIDGLPCIEATGMDSNNFKSYLCIISGRVLADLYDAYGARLLEGNVRSFLSTKVAVNKKIRNTIANEPSRFFAYNNGIATTAMGLRFKEVSGKGRYITGVTDLQIINGGQTTASLSSARYKDKRTLENIYVQMKLTEIDSGTAEIAELIRKISHSSNSQNKVSDADFFSVHPFHQEMENLSTRCYAPQSSRIPYETHWFYERARGQYMQNQMRMTKGQRDAFLKKNPKNQLITKTDLAKFRNSWEQFPNIVSKGAQTNFLKFSESICGKDGSREWENVSAQYGEYYFKETVAIAIIFRTLEVEVSKQTWYQNSYRANIITYTIALFSKMIANISVENQFSLMSIWEKQEVPSGMLHELLKIAEFVQSQITREDRGVVNVTQWCKQERCWTFLQQAAKTCGMTIDVDALEGEGLTKSTEEIKQIKKDSGVKAKLSIGINALNFVFEYKKWNQLKDFVDVHFDLDKTTSWALKCACDCERGKTRNLPDEKGAKALIKLLERAMDEGFQK